jgi:hypothetical protein
MKLTMILTLDGLVRALRWRGHALAELTGRDYAPARVARPNRTSSQRKQRREVKTHDVAGR